MQVGFPPFRDLGLVFVGGFVGTGLRFLADLLSGGSSWATLGVNLLGAFLLGLLVGASRLSLPARLLVGTGALGSFTTYSGLAADLATYPGLGNWVILALSLLGGLVFAWLGFLAGSRR